MDLQTVKFVNYWRTDKNGKPVKEVADIPISQPQKIRAYIDMGDLQPKNAANNDHGWRVDPVIAAKIRETLEDPIRLEEISKQTTTPLDLINAFHVLMYEINRNRQLAQRAAKNSLDKELMTAEYEREVAAAREGRPEEDESEETVPEPGTGGSYTPKKK